MALVLEKHAKVRQDLEALVEALARADQDQINAANAQLADSLRALGDAVAREHWPTWLQELLQHTQNYKTNHANGIATWKAHIKAVMANYPRAEQETWSFSDEVSQLFDIDALVEQARREHGIDALFVRILEILNAIAECDDLDSVKACSDLRRVIANLEKARTGSFSSQVFNWQFARRLVSNILIAYTKRSSAVGPMWEAFEQTAAEMDASLARVKDQVGEAILESATAGLRTDCAKQIDHHTLFQIEHHPELRSNEPNEAGG